MLAEGATVLGSWAVVMSKTVVITIQDAARNDRNASRPQETVKPTLDVYEVLVRCMPTLDPSRDHV